MGGGVGGRVADWQTGWLRRSTSGGWWCRSGSPNLRRLMNSQLSKQNVKVQSADRSPKSTNKIPTSPHSDGACNVVAAQHTPQKIG